MEEDGNANIKKFMPLMIAGFVACALMVVGFSFIDMVSNKSQKSDGGSRNQGGSAGGLSNNPSPAMQQAIDQARRNWPEFVQAFRNAHPGDAFLVKSAFSEGGPVEHMWVNVKAMDDRSVSGTLDSNPQILQQVKAGAQLQLGLNEIEDWTYVSGGQRHGYFTYAAALADQQAAMNGAQDQQQQGMQSQAIQGQYEQSQGEAAGNAGAGQGGGGLNGLLQNFLGGGGGGANGGNGANNGFGQGAQEQPGADGQSREADDDYARREQEEQQARQDEQAQLDMQREQEEQARQEAEQGGR